MVAAVADGRVAAERLDRSVRRMLDAKAGLGLFAGRTVPLDSVMARIGTRESQRLAQDIAARSVTLVRDTAGTVRALRARPRRLALIAYGDELNGGVGVHLAEVLRGGGDTVEQFRLWPMSGPASYDSARAVIARAPVAVFAANVRPVSWKGFIALPDSLARLVAATDSARPTVLVSLGSPYLLNQVPTVGAYLIAWSGARAAEWAVAQAILGRSPITGRLPIRIPPAYPIGHGIRVTEVRPPPGP
jgi:beta-N-acetylhexosaminidase